MEPLFRENPHHHREAIEKKSPENEATANRTLHLPIFPPFFEKEDEDEEEEDEANDDSKVIADGPIQQNKQQF